MSEDDKPINRRAFFQEGLRELFRKVGDAAGPLQRALGEFEQTAKDLGNAARQAGSTSPEKTPPGPSRPTPPRAGKAAAPTPARPIGLRILRPPGAKDEADFLATCSTCGNCVDACPVQCISIKPERAGGVPHIIASESPCVMCDGLLCMYSCPTGALTAIPIGLVDMGDARWFEDRCVRSAGTECTMCIDHCPIGPRAIELIDGKIAVHEEGCTGCGVCEHECPTTPKSILVIPRPIE